MQETRCDPAIYLTDELMAHVLSFVCGRRQEEKLVKDAMVPMEDAALAHVLIARVSRTWKNFLEDNDGAWMRRLFGPLKVELYRNSSSHSPCLSWLYHHKMSVGAVLPSQYWRIDDYDELDYIHHAKERILDECDTSEMLEIYHCYRESYEFQDNIAEKCPKLEHFEFRVPITENHAVPIMCFISPSLIAIPSLTKLTLFLDIARHSFAMTMEGNFFASLLENMHSLETLVIQSEHFRQFQDLIIFHIESRSLRILDVQGFPKGTKFSVECPRLETFRCKGYFSAGNGRTTSLPPQLQLEQKVIGIIHAPELCVAEILRLFGNGAPVPKVVKVPLRAIMHATLLPMNNMDDWFDPDLGTQYGEEDEYVDPPPHDFGDYQDGFGDY